ncbi:MAG: helix-turn-helix transcriptional regulator [Lachnospiraceae bacterium]|nr:helix-turn-helix transcriptional regulator [Lachnospiraceae bacterium]
MENVFKKLRMEKNPSEMEDFKGKDLAKELGIAAPKISELENGKRKASLSELQAYHNYFNVPYEYLLGESKSRHYENMVVSDEIGLSSESIETIKKIKENPTYRRILNIFIEKYITSLLVEISIGVRYIEAADKSIVNGSGKVLDNYCTYYKGVKEAECEALKALQDVTDKTGHIFRVVSGDDNVDYCKLKTGEIVKEAVEKILYGWID